jgi:hypothetical protein
MTGARWQGTPLDAFVATHVVEPRWAVQDVWPEGASGVIAGRPKDKKSTIAAELAVTLATGTPMFGLRRFAAKLPPARVLFVQQENATPRVQRDLQLVLAARGLGSVYGQALPDGEREEWFEWREQLLYPVPGNEAFEPATDTQLTVLSNVGIDLQNSDDLQGLTAYMEHYDYLFLDPLYQLAGIDERDQKAIKPILGWFNDLRSCGKAVVVTHHMSDKDGKPNEASSMLASTLLHAWYEAAVFPRSTEDHFVSLKVDAQRHMGTTDKISLQGLGVGRWLYVEAAQDVTDSTGRDAPLSAQKVARVERLRGLLADHPDWTNAQLAEAMGISVRTLQDYKVEIRDQDQAAAAGGASNG